MTSRLNFCLMVIFFLNACAVTSESLEVDSIDTLILAHLATINPESDAKYNFDNQHYRFLYISDEPASKRSGLDEFLRCYKQSSSPRNYSNLETVMEPFVNNSLHQYKDADTRQKILRYIEKYNSEMERHILDAGLDICNLLCNNKAS